MFKKKVRCRLFSLVEEDRQTLSWGKIVRDKHQADCMLLLELSFSFVYRDYCQPKQRVEVWQEMVTVISKVPCKLRVLVERDRSPSGCCLKQRAKSVSFHPLDQVVDWNDLE